MTFADVSAALAAVFPIVAHDGSAELEIADLTERGGGYGVVTNLILWAPDRSSVRDVKQQDVYFGPPRTLKYDRLAAFLRALRAVLARALAHPRVAQLLPHELLIWSPLTKRSLRTEEDYATALRARTRLGPLLDDA